MMNRFPKFKQSVVEDSSDCMNSDVEVTTKDQQNIIEDSNDSFLADRDNENSQSTSGAERGRIRLKITNASTTTPVVSFMAHNDSRLAECLDYLHRLISRKDKEDIFQLPVTDDIAPGYSTIIKNPMDLSTMKKKIESQIYMNITEYRDDLVLMCENCMTYNKPDTIYFHVARKLMDYGLKLLSKEKLISLRHTVRIMRYLTPSELGFSLEGDSTTDEAIVNKNKQTPVQSKAQAPRLSTSISKSKLVIPKVEIYQPKDSCLLPPEGDDNNNYDEYEDLAEEIKELAKEAAERLGNKNKYGRMGFLRRNPNGTTGYNFLKNSCVSQDSDINQDVQEKSVTIGNLYDGLQPNSYSTTSFADDRKNKSKPLYFLENGPFSSHAPQYDSSYTNLPKEETDILLTTYGDETAYQYALSLLEFSKGTTSAYGKYVNLVLNTTTNGEHEKYVQFKAKKEKLKLENKDEQQKQQQQTIEHKNEATNINNEIKNEQNDTIQSTNKSQEN